MVNQLPPEFDVQTLRRSDVATFPRSNALFIRSCRSLSKECLRTLLKSEGPTLFLKTAGCVGMSNQILNQHLEPLPMLVHPACPEFRGEPAAAGEGNSLVLRNGRRFQPFPESQTRAWSERLDPVGVGGNPPISPFRLRWTSTLLGRLVCAKHRRLSIVRSMP
jgi:hypothetical protein